MCILCGCDYCGSIKGPLSAFLSLLSRCKLLLQAVAFGSSIIMIAFKENAMRFEWSSIWQCAGIGAQTALKLIQKHGNLSTVLENLDSTKYPLPEPFPYDTAQQLFAGKILVASAYVTISKTIASAQQWNCPLWMEDQEADSRGTSQSMSQVDGGFWSCLSLDKSASRLRVEMTCLKFKAIH